MPDPKRRRGAPRAKHKQGGRRRAAAATARRRLATTTVRPLDPIALCGGATSVTHLLRVDETPAEGAPVVHLVFFDRHGWYCEHGRECSAVAAARAHVASSHSK